MAIKVIHSECVAAMTEMAVNGVVFDSIITDPPYEISFMSKRWDRNGVAFRVETWEAAIRVLKPGGHLLAFGGTRTYHRMVCAIEDAGFEIRDCIRNEQGREIAWPAWVYAAGFPKSLNVSAAIDDHFFREWLDANPEQAARLKGLKGVARKAVEAELLREAGLERKVVGVAWRSGAARACMSGDFAGGDYLATAPATPEAAQWHGWGTTLKPAWEPICVARKPLSERNVAANVLAHGCGGLNIDACRIPHVTIEGGTLAQNTHLRNSVKGSSGFFGTGKPNEMRPHSAGKWPANLTHDGSPQVLAAFAAFGESNRPNGRPNCKNVVYGQDRSIHGDHNGGIAPYNGGYPDSGSPARFFFSAKANANDRLGSKHPTVKPTDLIAWLLRLVTPPGGHVLDPFAGSGSTGMAAMREGFDATLIEMEAESVKDIHNRLAHVHGHDTPLFAAKEDAEPPTLDLFDGAA